MKKLMMLLVSFLVACSSPGEAPLTEAERAEIDLTIRELWDQTLSGIEEVDAAKAFSSFSEKPDTWYIRDGYLYPSIDSAEHEYTEGFKALSMQQREIDTLAVNVLGRSVAVLYSLGRFAATDTEGITHPPMELAWSAVWRLEDVGWRIANMHISFPPR